MADVDFSDFDLAKTGSAQAALRSCVRDPYGKLAPDETLENLFQLQELWRRQLGLLADIDWPPLRGVNLQYARNCPPSGSTLSIREWKPCQLPICPFCWGRRADQLYQTLETACATLTQDNIQHELVVLSFLLDHPDLAYPAGEPYRFSFEELDWKRSIHQFLYFQEHWRHKLTHRDGLLRPFYGAAYRIACWPLRPSRDDASEDPYGNPTDCYWQSRHSVLLLTQPGWKPLAPPGRIQPKLQRFDTRWLSRAAAVARALQYPERWLKCRPDLLAAFFSNARQATPPAHEKDDKPLPKRRTTRFRFYSTYGMLYATKV